MALRGARAWRNLSPRELADKLGLTTADICELENGSRKITDDMAIQLGRALGFDPKVFL